MEKRIQQKKLDASAVFLSEIKASDDVFFTEYRGLSVMKITALRKMLRSGDATYRVVKNSVAHHAFKSAGKSDMADKYLTGPTAIALVRGESGPAAKSLVNFAKENDALVVKGAIIGGVEYDKARFIAYSALPTRLELVAMLARTLNEPVAQLARALQAVADQKSDA